MLVKSDNLLNFHIFNTRFEYFYELARSTGICLKLSSLFLLFTFMFVERMEVLEYRQKFKVELSTFPFFFESVAAMWFFLGTWKYQPNETLTYFYSWWSYHQKMFRVEIICCIQISARNETENEGWNSFRWSRQNLQKDILIDHFLSSLSHYS